MIVNFREMPYASVKLTIKDLDKLSKGHHIISEAESMSDDPILVHLSLENEDLEDTEETDEES